MEASQLANESENTLVRLERLDEGTLAVLTLDDPARINAMSVEMGDRFRARVGELIADPALRCVIVRASGPDFSIGGTRQMLAGLAQDRYSPEERRAFMLDFYDRWLSVLELPVPVIAVIQGACIGPSGQLLRFQRVQESDRDLPSRVLRSTSRAGRSAMMFRESSVKQLGGSRIALLTKNFLAMRSPFLA